MAPGSPTQFITLGDPHPAIAEIARQRLIRVPVLGERPFDKLKASSCAPEEVGRGRPTHEETPYGLRPVESLGSTELTEVRVERRDQSSRVTTNGAFGFEAATSLLPRHRERSTQEPDEPLSRDVAPAGTIRVKDPLFCGARKVFWQRYLHAESLGRGGISARIFHFSS